MLVKHELCHLIYEITSGKKTAPKWLIEGLAIVLSGQLESKKRPEKFSSFLDHYSDEGKGVYEESGLVVEMLINRFGKEKIIEMVKRMKEVNGEEEVRVVFREVYGVDLRYESLNDLYTK